MRLRNIMCAIAAVVAAAAMQGAKPVMVFAEEESESQSQIESVQPFELNYNESDEGVFPRGISYCGISLEGKTVEEAKTEISDYVNARINRYIRLTVAGNNYDYTANDFGVTWENTDVISQLDGKLLRGNFIEQYKVQKDADVNPVDLDLRFQVDAAKLDQIVSTYVNSYTSSPKNATAVRQNGQFIVTEAVEGKTFDKEAIESQLTELLTDGSDESILYDFPYESSQAKYNSSYFNFSARPLGSYTTSELGTDNRRNNIIVSAQNMDGHIFYPGQEISTLAMFGDVSEAGGYMKAPGYENGTQVDVYGGGICQTTTTLYNAVLRAELTVTKRRAHSRLVTYVPAAMDATVSAQDGSDFKFVNSTNYPIYIQSYVDGDSVTVNIWGVEERAADREISFETDVKSVQWQKPYYKQVVNDEVCSVGSQYFVWDKTEIIINPHPAVHAVSYKIVTQDGQQTREKLNDDNYGTMEGLLYYASDCYVVVDDPIPSDDPNAVYANINWTINMTTYNLKGQTWPDPRAAQNQETEAAQETEAQAQQ